MGRGGKDVRNLVENEEGVRSTLVVGLFDVDSAMLDVGAGLRHSL
jgi:hypothetical protein